MAKQVASGKGSRLIPVIPEYLHPGTALGLEAILGAASSMMAT